MLYEGVLLRYETVEKNIVFAVDGRLDYHMRLEDDHALAAESAM